MFMFLLYSAKKCKNWFEAYIVQSSLNIKKKKGRKPKIKDSKAYSAKSSQKIDFL